MTTRQRAPTPPPRSLLQVTPISQPLWQRKRDDCLESFFAGMNVQHPHGALQCVTVGDLLFFSADDDPWGADKRLFPVQFDNTRKIRIGQILTLQTCKRRDTMQQQQQQQQHQQAFATVKWFWKYDQPIVQSTAKSRLQKQSLSELEFCRVTSLILETDCIETVSLQERLLPALVKLCEKKIFQRGDADAVELAPGCWELRYACIARLLATPESTAATTSTPATVETTTTPLQLELVSDLGDYSWQRQSPPESVKRAWKLEIAAPERLVQGYTSKSWPMALKPRFESLQQDNDDPCASSSRRGSIRTAGKENETTTTSHQPSAPAATRKEKAAPVKKTIQTKNKKPPTNKRAKKKPPPRQASAAANMTTNGCKKRAAAQTTTGKASKRSKQTQRQTTDDQASSIGEDTSDSSSQIASMPSGLTPATTATTPRGVQPLDQAVYSTQMKRTKSKQRNTNQTTTIRYYTGVELDLDETCCEQAIKRTKRLSQRWTVQVGDLIAVACPETSEPTGSRVRKGASVWFPFTQPWCPAQVLSIYRSGNNDEEEFFMEIRWFSRPGDLDQDNADGNDVPGWGNLHNLVSRVIVEVDEYVAKCSVDAALGRIVTTSEEVTPKDKWLSEFVDSDGVPQLPMICRYIHRTKFTGQFLAATDWSNYGTTLAGPLSRGLLCEKAKPGQDSVLRSAYQSFFRARFQLVDNTLADNLGDEESLICREIPKEWTAEQLACAEVEHKDSRVLHSEKNTHGSEREYLQGFKIPVVAQRCESRATSKKSTTDGQFWELQIGDVVCIAKNGATPRGNRVGKNPWSPFVAPWCIGQVLCIYRDAKKDGSKLTPLLEIRWFLRQSDVPAKVSCWMPPEFKALSNHEEFFETESVETDIPASHVLGRVRLFLGHHETEISAFSHGDGVPEVSCRCRFFYLSSMEQFQHLWCSSLTRDDLYKSMLERGLKLSAMHKQLPNIMGFLKAGDASSILFSSLLATKESSKAPETVALTRKLSNGSQRSFYLKLAVQPPWESYASADILFLHKDRANKLWSVGVGDLVAIRDENSSPAHPFTTSWKAAQVLAMYRDDPSDPFTLEVRRMYRLCEILESGTAASLQSLGLLYEVKDRTETKHIALDQLLGPVAMFAAGSRGLGDSEEERYQLWESIPRFVPVAPHVYGGFYDPVQRSRIEPSSSVQGTIAGMVERGVFLSSAYERKDWTTDILQALRDEAEHSDDTCHEWQPHVKLFIERPQASDDPSSPSSLESRLSSRTKGSSFVTRTSFSVPPFHTDHGSGTHYYTEIDVKPPYDAYANNLPKSGRSPDAVWTVRLGDPVILHYENSFGATSFGGLEGDKSDSKFFPMQNDVPWSIGEIVTIMQKGGRATSAMSESSSAFSCDGARLEIRWLYRSMELPGSIRKQSKTRKEFECETIFESDHYAEISPSCLVAPVELHEENRSSRVQLHLGMPIVQFTCTRFFSVHRRSLIPTSGLDGRIERARAHSRHFGSGTSVRAAFDSLTETAANTWSAGSTDQPKSLCWKDAFQRVIEKMSLTDASKEGFENGSMLIGRERERAQLRSFLRGAITGSMRDGNKACLFVAGPPGVGKTASIRAVVNELLREKSSATMPNFEFVALNGMEMRNPFEAYVKLWEALIDDDSSLDRSRGCSPEAAVRNLDAHFSSGSDSRTEAREVVTVVLLDEIDYLVTTKQTVLYNFFNWPAKAIEVGSKRRLVVIGVSNTLNLRDRLQPRVQSRIGCNDIYFKAYGENQTIDILTAKVRQASPHYKVFDEDAIVYASKKTAARSGDIRKAFYICRVAAEMILNKSEQIGSTASMPVVHVKDVLEACKESFNSVESKCISMCAPFEALLLITLAALRKSTGREVGGFDMEEILSKMDGIATSSGDKQYLPPPSLQESLGMLTRLAYAGVISMTTPRQASISYRASLAGCGGAWPLVSLSSDDTALLIALKRTKHSSLAQKHLAAFQF